ncbi:MAG: pilin [Patescibacteria group bacterium]
MTQVRALPLLSATLLLGVPLVSHAADLPLFSSGWSLVPEACRSCPCGFSGVMGIAQNLINAGISVGILFAVVIMAWAGFMLVMSPFNPEAKSTAHKMLINAVIGFLIVCSAWLIVDFVMKTLYSGPDGQRAVFGPWNSILTGGDICVQKTKNMATLFSGAITAGQLNTVAYSGGSAGSASSGARCQPAVTQSNPCSVTNMQKGCFAARASDAAIICNLESAGGNPRVESGSDRLSNGKGPSYSIGLWQINLTVHEITKDGKTLKCPTAFTNPCKKGYYTDPKNHPGWCNSEIKNTDAARALYAACVAAAKDPVANTAAACSMDKNRDFSDWACSASRCQIAGSDTVKGCEPGT